MSQLALFGDATEVTRHPHSLCDGTCLTHVLMPNMAYACGETILTVAGHFEMGTSRYENVTCPGCRECGIEQIRARVRRQQGMCGTCGERLDSRDNCKAHPVGAA